MPCPGQNPLTTHGLDADTIASVQAHTGLDVIRLRPAMFIGSTDMQGLSHLLVEFVLNSLAEVAAGFGNSVRVTLHADGSAEVADDGRTLPEGDNIEQVFTFFGSGYHGYRPNGDGREYQHYLIANALAERFTVFVRGDNSVYQHAFRRGVTHAVLQSGGPPNDRGLTVRFLPDPQIFGDAQFDADAIRDRLRVCAFSQSGVRITFTDEMTDTHDEFEHADGVFGCVQHLNATRKPLHADVIRLGGEEEGVRYEVGLQWCDEPDESGMSFVNSGPTPHGGTHTSGVLAGARLGLYDYIRAHVPQAGELKGDDLRTGLTAVVSVWLAEPTFEGRMRTRLNNPEVEAVLTKAVRNAVREYFEANTEAAKRVVESVLLNRDARVAAKAARQQQRKTRKDE